jgi:hypothetical protein
MRILVLAGALVALAFPTSAFGHHAPGAPGGDFEMAGPRGGAFKHVPFLGPARRAADGMLEVRAGDGTTFTTHGHDAVSGQELAAGTSDEYYAQDDGVVASNVNTVYPAGLSRPPICATAGRVRLIYVQPADRADRASTDSDMMRDTLARMNGWLYERGRAYSHNDVRLDIRTECSTTTGRIIVNTFRSGQNSNSVTFEALRTELANAGYNLSGDKYLVMWDFPVCDPTGTTGASEPDRTNHCMLRSGVAELRVDDRRVWDNRNNQNANDPAPMFALVYGVRNFRDNTTALHEMIHTMGGTQNGAPFAAAAGHCWDELEVMCYDDDGDRATFPIEQRCQNATIDCFNDTYFDPFPEPGEWLETHWNIGTEENRFLRNLCISDGRAPHACASMTT